MPDPAVTELIELMERLEAVEAGLASVNAVTNSAMKNLGRPSDLHQRLSTLEERVTGIDTVLAEIVARLGCIDDAHFNHTT